MPIQVPILMYHALDDRPSPISVHPKVFEWQMGWLHQSGLQVIPLAQVVECLINHQPLPKRSVVLTFDDGLESVYSLGFPVLARYEFPATVFLVSNYCGGSNNWPTQPPAAPRSPLMSWAQIREMDEHGIEFGAHTLTHPRLDQLHPDEIEDEVVGCKSAIEDRLGHGVQFFAYPYGRHSRIDEDLVSRTYVGACGGGLGYVGPKSDPFALERVDSYYTLPIHGCSRASRAHGFLST